METPNQATALPSTFSKLKNTITTCDALDKVLSKLRESKALMDKIIERNSESSRSYVALSDIAREIQAFFQDGLMMSTDIEDHELNMKGTANVNGWKVTCNGQLLHWETFVSLRDNNVIIRAEDEVVEIDDDELTIAEYLAARAAHKGIPAPRS